MTSLIPVTTQRIGESEVQTVDARELHAFLEVRRDFSTWVKDRIEQGRFSRGTDFEVVTNSGDNLLGGRPFVDYALSLDMAKHLAMLERSEKGHQVREYFIAVEKAHREAQTSRRLDVDVGALLADPRTTLRLLTGYAAQIVELQETVEAQRPAVEFAAQVGAAVNDQGFAEVAKALGTGRQRLIDALLEQRILYRAGPSILPRQEHLDTGRFVVREGTHERRGEKRVHATTRVTGKGLVWLQRIWGGRAGHLSLVGGAR